MSWSEIKKKKEEEEKKKKSTNTSDSTVKQISNVVTGSLWKNIGQNIITSQRNAEARKQKEEEFKRKLNINQNIHYSQNNNNIKREIQPSAIQTFSNNSKDTNSKNNTSIWDQIKNIVNNKNAMTLASKNEIANATRLSSADIDAMKEANNFNKIMKNGSAQEKFNAVTEHFGNSIIGGAKQTVGGVANIGTTLASDVVKTAKLIANEKEQEKLDNWYNKIVDKGREINDKATYFNKVNSRLEDKGVRTVTGATNTVANVATNALLTAGTGGGAVLQGLQVGGSSAQEVLNENKDASGKAMATGIAKGITSYLTEKMFDANILTKGAEKSSIQKLVNNKIESKIKSQLGRNIADKATGIIGENLEEIVEDNVGNLIDRVVNNKKLPEWKEWLNNTSETIKATTLSTAILNLVGLGGDNNQDIEADLRKQNASEQDIQKAKEFVQAVTQENIQSQNTDNQVINQENKMPQNQFSQAEKTEALRQEARNKLESIKQNYDENSYNQMQEFIETAPSEKALNQVINDLNKEVETKQVAPINQKQEVQLPMKQETQNKSFEDVAFEAMSNYESNEVESPLKNRDMDSIGKQTKVNAYQYDNPQVKPYFQEMAQQMGEDLAYISSSDNRSTQKGGGTKLSATTKAMDILHNEQGYSYNQIAQGLQNIIDDKGSENNAISKKIELVIDEQLRNGYNNAFGKYVEPNQEYINTIQGNKDVQLPMKQKQEVSLPLNENVVNNQNTSQEQYSLTETQPQNNFKYEQTDNEKVNKLYESTSKYFDDSQKTHNMLKPMEKIVRDKGYNIVFDDTLGDNINGRIRTNQDTGETEITINPNSNRKGEFIIGHELTHAIETQEMVDLVKKRMEKDGKLRNAVEDLKRLYGTDDINGEVLAEISGQLFGNQEFINNLSIEKPSVFKRIYDKIISLANKITGNSNEALFIKDLKNKWEKAYRENNNNIREAQYSETNIIKDNKGRQLSNQQQEYFKDSKVRDENGNLLTVYHGSNSEFNIFDLSKGGQSNSGASIGFWFTESKEGAENFANEVWYGDKKPNAKEVYLDMKNPKVYENIENDGQKQMYKEKSEKLEKEAKDLRKEYSWDKTDYKTTMTFDTLLRDYQTEKYTKQPVNIELFEGLAKERGFNDEQISKMEKDAKEYVRLMEESKKAENEYYKFLYSDAYEQYKIDLYEVAGQTAEDANVGGLGMALNNPKETVEKFRNKLISEGYDGIIIKNTQYDKSSFNGANNQYVIFNSNQAKNVNNTNPTTNPDIRYSLSEDGAMKDNKTGKKVTLQAESMNDGKNLLAIHNLDESKLKGVLELGGFPVPSIAITNPDIVNHSQFGDISVIFNKNTINPEIDSRNEVYDRDVWSPTFPQIEYDVNVKALNKVRNIVGGYGNEYLREANSKLNNIDSLIGNKGYEKLKDELKNNKAFKYVYYKTINPDFNIFTKMDSDDVSTRYSNQFLKEFIDEYGKEIPSWVSIDSETRKKIVNKFKEKWIPILEEKRDRIIAEEKAKAEPRKFIIGIAESTVENNLEWLDSLGGQDKLIENLNEIQRTGGTKEVKDYSKTNEFIDKNVNQKDYEQWLDDNFKNIVGKKGIYNGKEYLTSKGNRRTFNQLHEDYNLSNLVKELTKQSTVAGESGFGAGQNFGTLQAKMSNKFNSIQDIKNAENRIQYDNDTKELLDKYSSDIYEYMNELREYSYNKNNDYYYGDNAGYALNDFADYKVQNVDNLKKALEKNGINSKEVPSKLLNDVVNEINELKNIPTDYFEAKPQRAVGFDEIDAIVIPKDVSKEVKQQLKDRGIKTIEYDRNNENERADILKSLNEYKFSKTSKSWQDYLEKNYKSEGTTTDLRDIRLPMKKKQEVKAPLKQGNVQQNQNNNTPGENINWNEIERPENNQKFRKHYRSIIESSNTTAEAKAVAKELMGADTYTPETNKGQLAQADQRIMSSTPEAELNSLLSRAINGEKITSVDIAVGERLIQYFSKTGNKQQLQEAIQATAMAGTTAGQTVQALSMLNHQTPQGQATWIQRSVDKMNQQLAKQKGGTITTDADGNLQVINKQGVDITDKVDLFNLTPEMIDKIMNSENQEQMYKNIDEVYEELGQQVPKGMLEKIDSWRYFSMLANARTHIRNMVGNLAMGKTQRIKDKLAGGIEDVVSKFNPKMERTKTLAFADKKTKDFAKQDFKNMEVQSRLELNENKYNPQSRLQNARRTFKSNAMENTLGRLFNLNDKLLEAEDGIGLKAGYQKALADYITANKIDVDNITDAQLNKARNYAVQQAKEATFHQANAIASAVAQFENKNLATKLFTGAVLPFKKTPMNVAKAGMEYSPLQIAKSATVDLVNLRKGNISVNQYIDNLSKGMTGTGIALVGYALANAGILKASGGDDKDKEKYDEEQGKQSYSIQIAGKTYSLDWLAPTGIPLFIGAETHKLFNQEENEKGTEKRSEEDRLNQAIKGASNLLNAGATAINPMSEMSMISGLTSALSSYNTSDNLGSLGNMMTNMGKSYVNQFFPTLMGQVAKTGDEYERTTKSTAKGTIGKAVDQTINQIMNKIPGLRQKLPIKTDIWGKEVKQEVNLPLRAVNNFINPATVKEVSTDKVDMELNKLYEENRNSALLPDILTKTVQLNKQTYRLSNKEYAEFTKNYGQTSHKLIENFIKTSDYNKLTQEQKETAISNIYSYAKEQNKLDYAKKVGEEVKESTLYTTMKEIEKGGGKQSEYLSYLAKTKGMSKESEKNKVLADSNYSNKTKEIIYTNGTGKDDNLYNNLLSKSNINMSEYLDYKDKVSNKAFSADKDKNGKTVTGSAKAKVINYLNNNITGVGNRLLIAGKSYALQNNEKQKLAQYINSIANTREERIEIYKQLDKNFYVRNGKVYMRVSK